MRDVKETHQQLFFSGILDLQNLPSPFQISRITSNIHISHVSALSEPSDHSDPGQPDGHEVKPCEFDQKSSPISVT